MWNHSRLVSGCLATLVGWVLATQVSWGVPFVPRNDGQIVETLRAKPMDASWQETRRLRGLLREQPSRLDVALQLATRYIEQSRSEADPRYLGHAQSVLAAWLNLDQPPPSALLLRATIRQSLHEFEGALEDVKQVLRADPRNPQAWLTAAVIHQVQGRYDAARQHCAPLVRWGGELPAVACAASVGSLDGHAGASYGMLSRVAARAEGLSEQERQWVWTLLGDIAERLGRFHDAEAHYRAALATGVHDPYLLAVYADFLLDRGRLREVFELLKGERKIDALLLRLTLAEAQLGMPESVTDQQTLGARFDASRRRGDRVHQREESRYALQVSHDAARARRLAQDNWQIQKEPADARVLLEAVLAEGSPEAARPVLEWFRANRVEDVRLQRLVRQLEGRP